MTVIGPIVLLLVILLIIGLIAALLYIGHE